MPAFAAKPAIEAFSYGTATPTMGELAEAALAYTHDEPHAATTQAATLTLVTDNDDVGEDAESVAVKAEASQLLSEIFRMDPEVKAGLGAEIALLKAAQQSGRASGVDFERIRDRIAAVDNAAQNGKVETPEQRRERLWNEIEELNRKTLKGIDDLADNNLMGQDEADQWKDELTEIMAMPNGEEKARRLADFNQRYGDRLQQILDSLPLDDPRRELVERLIASEQEKDATLTSVTRDEADRTPLPPSATVAPEPVVFRDESLAVPDLQAAGVTQATEQATNTALPRVASAASVDVSLG